MIFTEFLQVFYSTDPILPRPDFKTVPVKCFGFLTLMKEFIIWKENCLTRSGNQVDDRKIKAPPKFFLNQAKNVFGQLQFFFEIVSEMRTLKN